MDDREKSVLITVFAYDQQEADQFAEIAFENGAVSAHESKIIERQQGGRARNEVRLEILCPETAAERVRRAIRTEAGSSSVMWELPAVTDSLTMDWLRKESI